MSHNETKSRRHGKTTPSWESLETRQLMTGGAGSIFAIIPGEVAAASGHAELRSAINPANFEMPSGRMVLGIDVAPSSGSTVTPKVQVVDGDATIQTRGVMRSFYSPFIKDNKVVANAPTSAVLVPITVNPRAEVPAGEVKARITAEDQSTGKFLAGYYLPGDANGDGTVDLSDREIVRSTLGAVAGQASYQFDADANRDGRVDSTDMKIVMMNQGVKVNVRPIASANLHEVSDSGTRDRRTVYQDVTFVGEATPGATVTLSEITGRADAISTTVGADGKYSARVSLAEGENKFELHVRDAFGQDIRGEIAAVTYLPPLVPVESPLPPQPAGTVDPTPTTPEDPADARFRELEARFPNAIKQLSPDQAESLRKKLAKA